MAQQERDLPEGTDTVISGAMDTDTSDVTGDTSSSTGGASSAGTGSATGSATGGTGSGDTAEGGGDGSRQSRSTSGGGLMNTVKSGSDKLSAQAADKARDFVGQGIERSAEAIANVSRLIGDTASGLDDRLGEEYGTYARRAAETLEGTANRLAAKDPDELIDDTREFIRKSPGVALAGAAIAGFAIARLIKSGLSLGEDDGEDEDRRSRSGSRKA